MQQEENSAETPTQGSDRPSRRVGGMKLLTTALAVCLLAAGKSEPTISDDLIAAIIQVESSGDNNAVGDGGKAVGAFQIWPVMVDDCNRIAGEDRWTNDDRTDRAKSRAMFITYSRHYAKHHSDWSNEGIARRWNGGPRGHKKAATEGYWAKVRKQLEGGAK